MLMLEHYKINTAGMHAVVIGRSNIVGRPMSILLSENKNPGNCTVTLCHSKTINIAELCRDADIIVAALGRPGFIKEDWVKEGEQEFHQHRDPGLIPEFFPTINVLKCLLQIL